MINIINEHEFDVDELAIEQYINYLRDKLNVNKAMSLVFLDADEVQSINLEFRAKDYATDVLTFCEDDEEYLGDVLINYFKISEQAQLYNHSEQREMYFLITHGFLHLLGYDHLEKEEEKVMFDLQEQLLTAYNVRRDNE